LAGDAGRVVTLDLLPVIQKRISITGASLRRRPMSEKAALAAAIEHRVWPWIARGSLRPEIGLVLPLAQVQQAHQALEERRVTGKIILTTQD
jgi:NADPH2:quinone reductase